ncbi:uncharacterized protein Z520_03294 [Fonsecaea multimorphosa CBS 102226]|uniref:Uncharacterized protein n=1 Tax=Fonsecaea multimorphosa CBS 102226 TaxID=1442371 RepID=A0A0D2HFB8_9EURO|nr:uncharacterized protein Z520_03294 [Fonsecaea multimorphosa CBS 102226]KIY00631.1 hypothetical protein Z520_03294 [Fonsecaea multimorphosa CBS 102226]OAL19021.1 hypothetical protein AYO22_10350 [Fonsecaea multimorphosa]
MLGLWEFDNEETILQLLDRNVRRRELIATVDNVARDHLMEEQDESEDQDLDLSDPYSDQQLTLASTFHEAAEESMVTKTSATKHSGPWLELTARTNVLSFVLGIFAALVLSQLWATMTTARAE